MAEPNSTSPGGGQGVTRAEQRVLALVVARYPNTEIAERLGVSKRTVESHVSALFRKFAVSTRRELIRRAGALAQPVPRPVALPDAKARADAKARVELRRRSAALRHSAMLAQRTSIRQLIETARSLQHSRALLEGSAFSGRQAKMIE